MKISRLIAAGAAAALTLGAFTPSAQAQQQETPPTLQVAQSEPGSKVIDFLLICGEGYAEYVIGVGGDVLAEGSLVDGVVVDDEEVDGVAAGQVEIEATAASTTITATCFDYQGVEESAQASVDLDTLFIEPSSWQSGDTITIGGFGLQAGENVTITMVRVSDGQTYWTTAGGSVGDDGHYEYSLVLESDVPLGSYLLIATGETSGSELSAEFYWGSPDDDDPTPTPTPSPTPTQTPSPGKAKPGLPSTGV